MTEEIDASDKSDSEDEFAFSSGFHFVDTAAEYFHDTWSDLAKLVKKKKSVKIDEKISKAIEKRKSKDLEPAVQQNRYADEGKENVKDTLRTKKKKGKDPREKQKAVTVEGIENGEEEEDDVTKAFFGDGDVSFQQMNLSRPLLKALTAMNFIYPTPIQASTIPMALLGRDIYACAATGTGKTAAFMLPVLERLLFRPKQDLVTRVLVVVPTRELAVQVYQVSLQLAQFTNVMITLSAGGLDLKAQEAALRKVPDIIIATPGRLIDHLENTPGFDLRNIEVLILDEADKMLDETFASQMKEIIRQCAPTRQTMLFSATMTEEVKDLAAVSLQKPVKLFLNNNTDVALNLRQEFIRIRPQREGDREAILAVAATDGAAISGCRRPTKSLNVMSICCHRWRCDLMAIADATKSPNVMTLVLRTFHDHTIVFVQTKKLAHRLRILLGLLGARVDELHGNLNQSQRLEALHRFKEMEVDVLVTTDLVARGLDIKDVKTVINFTLPHTVQHYVHRVGRTARAGKSGRSVSMVGEQERKLLKEIVKQAKTPVKQRILPPDIVAQFREKIAGLEQELETILEEEKAEKELGIIEKEVDKATDLVNKKAAAKEPQRTWFQTPKEKFREQVQLKLGKHSKHTLKRMKIPPRAQNAEDRVSRELEKTAQYQARMAKRAKKPKRIRAISDDDGAKKMILPKGKKGGKKRKSFDAELVDTSQKAVKKFRYGPTYKEKVEMGLVKKSKGPVKKFKSKSRYRRK
ncbi:hypothetical protein V5799_022358 [Amblyomma americanum]|uniref:RNA helicase n=1 Tax=Amblyomma americanum TaxID=6943 RepID=A0AAQ4FKQ6_AMBAM